MWVYQYSDRIALESLERAERPDPRPGPHDIVIKMGSVALNHRDIAIARGRYHISVQPPVVPLSDGAGRVVETGREVTRFRIGDLAAPVYLPDWIDGPVTAQSGTRRLGGPTDGVLSEFKRARPCRRLCDRHICDDRSLRSDSARRHHPRGDRRSPCQLRGANPCPGSASGPARRRRAVHDRSSSRCVRKDGAWWTLREDRDPAGGRMT
jgi:hypothetical protein